MPNNNSIVKKKEEVKPAKPLDKQRSGSVKKQVPAPKNEKKPAGGSANRVSSEKENDEHLEEEMGEEIQARMDKVDKKKVKEDVNKMKSTLKNNNVGEEYFAFQEKVSNIYEEQEEVFATHMAAIKEDAKLLTQES